MRAALKWQLAAALSLAAVLSSGCVDERAFFITANLSACLDTTSTTTTGPTFQSTGVLDLTGRRGYTFYPEVRNEMLPSGHVDGEPERNRLLLRRFEVELNIGVLGQGLSVPSQLTSFAALATGLIEPGGAVQSTIKLVPDGLATILTGKQLPIGGGLIIAKVQAVADHNGSDLKSVEFEYPIEVCNGCLVTLLADCPTTTPKAKSNACGLPQDAKVVCCDQGQICYSQDELSALGTVAP